MASTSVPSASVQPPLSPYSFPVAPSPSPVPPEDDIPLATETIQPASPEYNPRRDLPPSPLASSGPPASPFLAPILRQTSRRTSFENRFESVGSMYSDGEDIAAPLPFLKTAMSKSGMSNNVGNNGSSGMENGELPTNRLTSAKRTVSWADLTNTGTALTHVKEYQPECPPASPLSDSSWEQSRPSCFCSIM